MKRILKRPLLCLVVIIVLMITTSASFANEFSTSDEEELTIDTLQDFFPQNQINVYGADVFYGIDFVKTSSTKATANVYATCVKRADVIISTITLQKYSSSKSEYIDTSAASATQTVKNTNTISHRATFKINDQSSYRIKVVLKVKIGGTTTTNTFYKKML